LPLSMEDIAALSREPTKRILKLLTAAQYWGIPREFKMSPGLTVDEIEHSIREFEVTAYRLVMPPEQAFNSIKIFNFDDQQYTSGPLPRGATSHNTIIYVSDFGTRWVQDFFLWSATGRTKHVLKLVFRSNGRDVDTSYDGIVQLL
jgi:hypothetical protein